MPCAKLAPAATSRSRQKLPQLNSNFFKKARSATSSELQSGGVSRPISTGLMSSGEGRGKKRNTSGRLTAAGKLRAKKATLAGHEVREPVAHVFFDFSLHRAIV
jgi:hypothetical protein